jgi:hypothetical protein
MILKRVCQPSWRMREEGEMVAFVADCPECGNPADVVVSSALLREPLSHLPDFYCSRCRKRFPCAEEVRSALPLRSHRGC